MNIKYSKEKMYFFDLTIYKNENSLLHYHSFHSSHLKKNVPSGQLQKVWHICDSDSDIEKQADSLSERFRERPYKSHVITNAFEKVRHLNCNNLLHKSHRRRRNPSNSFFVTHHSTKSQKKQKHKK